MSMQIEAPEGYESLGAVLQLAVDQAAKGKGLARHATGEPFDQQKICRIPRAVGVGFALGQAIKKTEESIRLPHAAGLAELLGAINYLAAGYIVSAEMNPAEAAKIPSASHPFFVTDQQPAKAGGLVPPENCLTNLCRRN